MFFLFTEKGIYYIIYICFFLIRLRIRPKCLVGLKDCDLSTTILGEKVSMPLGISPTAMQRMAHPDGETANIKGTLCYNNTLCYNMCFKFILSCCDKMKWGNRPWAHLAIFSRGCHLDLALNTFVRVKVFNLFFRANLWLVHFGGEHRTILGLERTTRLPPFAHAHTNDALIVFLYSQLEVWLNKSYYDNQFSKEVFFFLSE